MKKIGIDYEITYSVYKEFEVDDDQYEAIQEGILPGDIMYDLVDAVQWSKDGDWKDDWAAHDLETGKCLQDWR